MKKPRNLFVKQVKKLLRAFFPNIDDEKPYMLPKLSSKKKPRKQEIISSTKTLEVDKKEIKEASERVLNKVQIPLYRHYYSEGKNDVQN